IYMLVSLTSIGLGALMFFYVEECYFKVQETPEYSRRCQELCVGLMKLNETLYKNLVHTPDLINGFNNLTDLCSSKNCIEKGGSVQNEKCEITDVKDYFYWFELPWSIAYTVGYGRVVAKSDLGKFLTIIYAMFAIPITTASVVFLGRFITAVIKYLIIFFESRVLKRDKITKFQRKVIFIEVLLNIILVLILSLLYKKTILQHQGFLESVYYVLITISTIGFGDVTWDFEYVNNLTQWELLFFLTTSGNLFCLAFASLASLISTCVSQGTERSYKNKDQKSEMDTLDDGNLDS
uniref:Potassium channel domain-containing protein n=2 Tax=Clytia hemisphaerica TaxID=252671 RepID=A0A7M5U2V6_9CNID